VETIFGMKTNLTCSGFAASHSRPSDKHPQTRAGCKAQAIFIVSLASARGESKTSETAPAKESRRFRAFEHEITRSRRVSYDELLAGRHYS
jgi:hypothetical protein